MGVNPLPTGGIYKYFSFDGETSASFGVHITGEGVFNAPKRAVEMVSIPARNGAFALDQGYFENIEVTYKASIVADNDADFADAVSGLRNFLCSRTGYCRLEDDYNPTEFRMAVYKSGLEVTPFVLKTGEFNITFDCKPQRFLKSGESQYVPPSGGTLTNPTLFDAKPLLKVHGYGNIDINGNDIDLENVQVGDVRRSVSPANKTLNHTGNTSYTFAAVIPSNLFADGDTITIGGEHINFNFNANSGYYDRSATNVTEATNCACTVTIPTSRKAVTIKCTIPQYQFTIGTASTFTSSFKYNYNISDGLYSGSATIAMSTAYSATTGKLTYTWNFTSAPTGQRRSIATYTGIAFGTSTMTIPSTIYIDLDIGEVWTHIDGAITVLNNAIQFPAELPTLPSGASIITYDNTFTDFVVVPRWWRV